MSIVFINYRREDTAGEARLLFADLTAMLGPGSVFMDVDGIALGRDFRDVLEEKLRSAQMVLTLIGRQWLHISHPDGRRRLDEVDDHVRSEIRTALALNLAVTPILVQKASMPVAADLPQDVQALAYRNGFELSHNRWSSDVRELVVRLGLQPAIPTGTDEVGVARPDGVAISPQDTEVPDRSRLKLIGVTGLALAAGTAYFFVPKDRGIAAADAGFPNDPRAGLTLGIFAKGRDALEFLVAPAGDASGLTLPIDVSAIDKAMRMLFLGGHNPKAQPRTPTDAKALAAMLLPPPLRQKILDAASQRIRLVLDAATAWLPWELVLAQLGDHPQPVRVVRSLRGVVALASPRRAPKSALILVNPEVDAKYPSLPGASAEGKAAQAMLTAKGFSAQLSDQAPADDVARALLGSDYRFVLVAAHAQHEPVRPADIVPAGIVLSDSKILSAGHFEAMRSPPDLIFLNTSRFGAARLDSETPGWRDKLFIARLIRAGVRTVIVPTGEIEDEEAGAFSRGLVSALVDGLHDIEGAFQVAVAAALKRRPADQSWAAYQMYGHVDYRIDET
jgi:CHAT domain/TIR domain